MGGLRIRIIVGDKFTKLAEISSFILFSDWKKIYSDLNIFDKNTRYIPGQGLNDIQQMEIIEYNKSQNIELDTSSHASTDVTHKKIKKNILITHPYQNTINQFESRLVSVHS